MPSLQNNCKLPDALVHWSRDHETTLGLRFPMHRACRDGDINSLNHLLTTAENHHLLSVQDPFLGWTPAHWAAFFGQVTYYSTL